MSTFWDTFNLLQKCELLLAWFVKVCPKKGSLKGSSTFLNQSIFSQLALLLNRQHKNFWICVPNDGLNFNKVSLQTSSIDRQTIRVLVFLNSASDYPYCCLLIEIVCAACRLITSLLKLKFASLRKCVLLKMKSFHHLIVDFSASTP